MLAAVGGPLARRLGRPRLISAGLALLAAPLRALTRAGDRYAVPLVKPR